MNTEEKTTENKLMKTLMDESQEKPLEDGDLVEGRVVAIDKASLFVDLERNGTGIIFGKEFINAKDVIKKINIGDSIKAKVVEKENEEGYVELSLEEAKQALAWSEAEKAIKERKVFELEILEANKGGLILNWQGVSGFLPASQLKSENYPRVEDGNKDKILKELKKMVGQKVSVSIIAAMPQEDKLIFSEKDLGQEEAKEIISKYSVGDEVECEVSGAVDFGLFLKLEEGMEGLVHISEIDWGLVDDPRTAYKTGDKVKAKIIEIKDGRISLSIKALEENPWKKVEDKYKKGDIVKGVVIKFNKHGALISVEEGVAGLVHHSTFESFEDLKKQLELGKTYEFQITFFDPKNEKMTLVHLDKEKMQNQ